MTGFRPKRAPFKLDFSGTEYEGLEVTVRPLPMSVMLDIGAAVTTADSQAFRQVAATFAWALESWNVEDDDGQPVAAGLDGLMSQDSQFILELIRAWLEASSGGAR